jgi:hypothetical protein
MEIRFSVPEGSFTTVPNDLLFCPLSPGEKVTWLQLASVCRNGSFKHHKRGIAAVATELDLDYGNFAKAVNRLKRAGGLIEEDGDMILVVPSERSASEPKEVKQVTIAQEVAELPKAKPTGISEKESWQAIRQAWDREKPEQWVSMGGFNTMTFIAICTQAKRLGIQRADYPDFVAKVCRGAKQDDWWSGRALKPTNVFGMTAQIEDKKFQNVEKLYKLGQSYREKFAWTDKQIYAWYAEALPDRKFTRIEWLEVSSTEEAWDHNAEHKDGDVIFIYTEKGKPICWTLYFLRKLRYTPE